MRAAEALQRGGDLPGAAVRLEAALACCCADDFAPVPGWLCGRLAAVYRSLKRYDDEVALLERYEATQESDEARLRFKARLTKARSMATSKRKQGNGAVSSVRQVLDAPRRSLGARDPDHNPE